MSGHSYVILDPNEERRSAVYRVIASSRRAIPVASVGELGAYWPQTAWWLVHDDPDLIRDAQHAIADSGVYQPIIGYGEEVDAARIVSAVTSGALHYVSWPSTVDSIENIDESRWFEFQKRTRLLFEERSAKRSTCALTTRELEVMQCICKGLSNKQAANALAISSRTVEIHRANALSKLGAKNSIEAVRIFLRAGDLDQDRSAAA